MSVRKDRPCPICEKPDWCSISSDGRLVACRRIEAGSYKSKTDKSGTAFYLHRRDGSVPSPDAPPPFSAGEASSDRADAETLGSVYSALLAAFPISIAHRENLRSRGLSDAEIDGRTYGSLPVRGRARVAANLRQRFGEQLLQVPGIVMKERDGKPYLSIAGAAGLLVPVRDVAGRIVAIMVRRGEGALGPRYTYLSSRKVGGPGPGAPVHVPRGIVRPCGIVRVTEGTLKADIAHALSGLATLGLPGVGALHSALHILQQLGASIIRLALDNDAKVNVTVARAVARLAEQSAVEGLAVEIERWPDTHKGIDDAFVAGIAIEVLSGADAQRVIAEILAEATSSEPSDPLDRLDEILATGEAEALFRDEQLLLALAQLAETNPAEFACRRAQLQDAGFKLRDLDRALAPLRQKLRAAMPKPDVADMYRIVGGRVVRDLQTPNGLIEVPLANWAGRIVGEVVRDDGAERTVMLAIEGSLQDGTPLPRIEVPAEDFPFMRWPIKGWGSRAVVFAGASTADHLRSALQLLSGDVPRQTVYTHTGWREIDSKWFYLHGGGGIGATGSACDISVALPDALIGYKLPNPPDGPALEKAIRASLRVLDVAPDRITVPLLGGVFRAVLAPCDSSIHLAGPTGTGKSELAALAQQHFGAGLDARHLPASWSSTSNSLEALAFSVADAVMVVDDFAPGGTMSDVARLHRDADRLMRAQGNSSGRMRMRTDGTLRPVKPPRGLIISTGEDIPRGQSVRARLYILELEKGELDWARLTVCQHYAAAGRFAEALAGFLKWIAKRYATVREVLRTEVAALRDRAQSKGMHARTPGIVADLAVGWQYFLEFARVSGAINQSEYDLLYDRGWSALQESIAGQNAHVASADPCEHFLRLTRGVLASGRGHCDGPNGGPPANPDAWGWRSTETMDQNTRCEPLGRCIGWVEGENMYLDPEAAFAEAQELGRHQGEGLSVAPRTLWKRLRERGLLESWDDARQRNTVRRRLGGVDRREVIHLRADTLHAPPSQPSQPSPRPSKHRENGSVLRDGRGDGPTMPAVDCPEKLPKKPRESCNGDERDGRDGGGDVVNTGGPTVLPPLNSNETDSTKGPGWEEWQDDCCSSCGSSPRQYRPRL